MFGMGDNKFEKFKRTVKLCYKGDSYRLDKSLVYNFFIGAIFVVMLLN